MKFNKWTLGLAAIAAVMLATTVRAQNSDPGLPSQIASQLPPGAPAFDPAGLSFTNVNYKAAVGTQMATGNGGTLTYAQADEDFFHLSALDIGLGQEITLSSTGNGLNSGAMDLELIKNLSNWQLVGKGGYGRNFENNVGNFFSLGFDVNYNLTKGAGLAFLGTKGGSFTYVGAGVKFNDKNFSLTAKQADMEKKLTIYAGFAF